MAGEIGANVLTHLLGQSIDELSACIRVYRKALKEHGHDPDQGCVSIMLHTFVGSNREFVRETVREPMIGYLRSALGLVKNFASQWTAFKKRSDGTTEVDMASLSKEEMDDLLEYSFERYFETSGLFGTPEDCMQMVNRLREVDVDEIACLVDFGVATPTVIEHLRNLDELRQLSARQTNAADTDFSLATEIRRHNATHLQCTPSTMSMYLLDEQAREAVAGMKTVMLGGEALPRTLAAQLLQLDGPQIINMYGPTETTIWSSTQIVESADESIPIGRPVANTQLYILDSAMQPVPVGTSGELYIGGDGVVRGYLRRPEWTADRFVESPFRDAQRLYRTGDLARYRSDGKVEFLGRVDYQVKVRGHRIELGEIEQLLLDRPEISDSVVMAREDVPGDQRLVAYLIPTDNQDLDVGSVRADLRESLPDFMVPSHFVPLDAFPLTPNAKIDRKALPAPSQPTTSAKTQHAMPRNHTEEKVIEIWTEVLGVERVGVQDNFFDMGGHSLLAVKAHRMLKQSFAKPVAITDLFRYPTVRTLAAFLEETMEQDKVTASDAGQLRGQRRRQLLRRRRS